VRVIGVVDLAGGRAVRAYAGRREEYQPIGDAVDLARLYVDRYGLTELYVADLDAIERGRPASETIRSLAGVGVPFFLDAGVSSVERAREALALGPAHLVVGLETLPSFDSLEEICDAVGGERIAFSLDLRDGTPVATNDAIARDTPERLARRAMDAGAGSLIVIDLARVGTRSGLDVGMLERVRRSAPAATLLAGGGVRGPDDLEALAVAGCDGALVATAIDALYPSATR
jgi:phosphoribosylformimino-5-aminoimidazole carboxamide ribotide isomerase